MRIVPMRREQSFYPMSRLMADWLNGFTGDQEYHPQSGEMPIDALEKEEEYIILANLPGIAKDKISISVKENQLIIEAKQDIQKEENPGVLHRSERFHGDYIRSMYLTDNFDVQNVKAKLEDGVLTLHIPKKKPEANKQIPVE